VTGPTGSGKSTTLAAMIDKINSEKNAHIITVEDPIEYIHRHKNLLLIKGRSTPIPKASLQPSDTSSVKIQISSSSVK